MKILERLSLPLLTKELIEQSQSKRTYILRVVYGLLLYGAALWQYSEISSGGGTTGLVNLGQGQVFFGMLIQFQMIAILVLLPAITCGAMTVEKEKDTLALLLITKLSPWTIVVEKLFSRVFAMGTFQLLSLPLFAIVYGIGGVELSTLLSAVVGLACLTLVVASVSILCSTWFRTTSEAFIMSYLLMGLLMVGINVCVYFLAMIVHRIELRSLVFWGIFQSIVRILSIAGTVIVTWIMLMIASRALVPRAFVPARNYVLEWFQRADRFFNNVNARTTGGIVLVPDRESLPLFKPITWRETRQRSLGTFRYQFRILMLLLTPLIIVIAAMLTDGRNDFTSPFRGFPVFFWFVSLICLTIHATGVIPAERIRQSLDVLLVAPLTSEEIVHEKLSGVRRLIKILSVPFAVSILFQAIWSGYVLQGSAQFQNPEFVREIVTAALTVICYMPMTMWLGFQFGLRLKTQIQAVMATFVVIGIVCIVPILLANQLEAVVGTNVAFLRWLSPLQLIFPTVNFAPRPELVQAEPLFNWIATLAHFALCGMSWWTLRANALRQFSRIVGRTEALPSRQSSAVKEESLAPASVSAAESLIS